MRTYGVTLLILSILIVRDAAVDSTKVCAASPGELTATRTKTSARDDETVMLLNALLPEASGDARARALRHLAKSQDKRFIAPLIDLMRFVNAHEEYVAILQALQTLTGERVDESENPWEALTVWYGAHTELQPPHGYTAWKGELHAQRIDPRFRQFLYDGAPSAVRVEEVVWGGIKVDGIPALVNPRMRPAAEAEYLSDDEPVFGVSINGDSRAYPLRILDWHEMANDVVDGRPVALAYCTLCGSGILYDATAAGQTYVFGSSGFLFRSNKLMYDRATYTLWNQLTGEPVIGKLVGRNIKLTVLPIVVTSWGEWRRQHPDTKAVDLDTGYERPYQVGATYGRYFASPDTMFPVWRQSRALAKKARIFAIQIDGRAKAYPLDALNREGGVVNDTLGSRPLVVMYRDAVGRVPLPESWQAALRRHGGTDATIALANDLSLDAARAVLTEHPSLVSDMTVEVLLAMPTEARLTLLSERTSNEQRGSRARAGMFTPDLRNEVAQRGLIGETRAYERGAHTFTASRSKEELIDERAAPWRATEDALVAPDGERLARLGGHLAYWFGWFSFYPQTELYLNQTTRAPP